MSLAELQDPNYLGESTDIEVLSRLVDWADRFVVDAGCANGALATALAMRGATVLGLEPDPVQAAANREAKAVPNVTLIEASAESIPREDHSVDVVVFSKSLHHVPAAAMDNVLREAARVLKPDSGLLIALEPDIRGEFSQLVKPFHDETIVRGQALAALDRTANPLFRQMDEYWYMTLARFPDFDSFVTRMASATYNALDRQKIITPSTRSAFESGKRQTEYVFTNLMRARLYRGSKQ